MAIGAERHAGFRSSAFESIDQTLGAGAQRVKKAGFGDLAQGGQATGCGHRVAAECARLVHRAGRRQLRHDFARTTEGCERHAATNHFAQYRHVGFEAGDQLGVNALGRTERHTETRHHFVKHQQRAVLGAQFAAAFHERHAGAHKVHVACDGFDHHAGQFLAVQGKGFFQLLDVVVFQHQGVADHFRGHPSAGGVAKGGQAGTGLDQQRIGMAVVAAFELDELGAASGTAGQPQGAHARFGARADQSHHFHGRHVFEDFFGQFDLALGRRTKRKTIERRFLNRFEHGGMAVAQNHRAP